MSKRFIAFLLLVLLTSACNQPYATSTPAAQDIPFAQPMASDTPTALFNQNNAVATSTPAVVTATAAVACSSAPAPHVKVGQQVTVTVEDWDKLKLRSDPEIANSTIIMELDQYTQLRILDGPICVSSSDTSFLFWKVAVIPSGEIGWVAEGDSSHYFME